MTCEICRELLNQALNLAVRSDQFEEQTRRSAALAASVDGDEWERSGMFAKYVERHNIESPHKRIAPTCLTMHLWVQDQYEKDLYEWRAKAQRHLTEECIP